jgi:hypothetical protein
MESSSIADNRSGPSGASRPLIIYGLSGTPVDFSLKLISEDIGGISALGFACDTVRCHKSPYGRLSRASCGREEECENLRIATTHSSYSLSY